MTCFQFLLLFFIFVSSIFAYNETTTVDYELLYKCKSGRTCGKYSFLLYHLERYTMQEPEFSTSCYYYRCRIGEWTIMQGFGTYDDFINTCKYSDPMIKREVDSSYFLFDDTRDSNYMYNDDNLILAICRPRNQKECEKIINDRETYKKIHQQFDSFSRRWIFTAFKQVAVDECSYNNTPLAKLPQVQCETGGVCQSGSTFRLWAIRYANFVNKTCDACVMFVCTLDGKQIIEGTGCYDDFVKVCKDVNPSAVAWFKRGDGFYHDKSMIVASCSDADNCHKYAFDNYVTKKILKNFYYNEWAEEKCSFEKMFETTTITPSTTTKTASTSDASYLPASTEITAAPQTQIPEQKASNGVDLMKIFFGFYFLVMLIF